jgi:hypothetical protein
MTQPKTSTTSQPSRWAVGLVFVSALFTATFAVLLWKALGAF